MGMPTTAHRWFCHSCWGYASLAPGLIWLDNLGWHARRRGAHLQVYRPGAPAVHVRADQLCWHQAPAGHAADFALHLELFTVRRAPGKRKFLAGTESGMGVFTQDVAPEAAAGRLRGLD